MKNIIVLSVFILTSISCSEKKKENSTAKKELTIHEATTAERSEAKVLNDELPTIGILIFEGFLTNEVVAPMDVFSIKDSQEKSLFNVIIIAKKDKVYRSEEGLQVLPDFVIGQVPELNVLVVPSSYHPEDQVKDAELVSFIKEQNKTTDYIASHCAGAFLLAEAGVADNKEIVTYVTGGVVLQKEYPNLKVMDDSKISVVEDGRIFSSNGSLVSYKASLNLLEKMTSIEHRKHAEKYLLLDRL